MRVFMPHSLGPGVWKAREEAWETYYIPPAHIEDVKVEVSMPVYKDFCSHCYGGELLLGDACDCKCHR